MKHFDKKHIKAKLLMQENMTGWCQPIVKMILYIFCSQINKTTDDVKVCYLKQFSSNMKIVITKQTFNSKRGSLPVSARESEISAIIVIFNLPNLNFNRL